MQRLRKGGFILITTVLFILISLISLTSVGLVRTMTDMLAANTLVATTQAFHTAEAGIDGYLEFLRSSIAGSSNVPGTVNYILNHLTQQQNLPCDVPNCTILEVKDDVDDTDPSKDSNKIIVIRVSGGTGAISQTIQATIYVDTSNPTVYPYSVAGKTINMDGNSTFGDPLEWAKTIIYAQGPPGVNGSFLADATNDIWASRVAFYNPTGASLAALCPACSNPSIFHPEPFTNKPTDFNTTAPKAPDLKIDLKPYYEEAVMEGPGHVISTTPSQPFKDTTLTGVYYVECGVTITFDGQVRVNGTIVHEGCGGEIRLLSHGKDDKLTIDSTAGTSPFSPGMAIIGAPSLMFKETAEMDITGLVMGRGGDVTNLKAHGTIHGSLIAVADVSADYPELASNPGPGSESVLTFPLDELRVENATIVFSAISGSGPPPETSGVIAKLRAWMQEDNP